MTTNQIEGLQELYELARTDPIKFQVIIRDNPHIVKKLEELESFYQAGTTVSVDGFKTFYEAIYDRPLPYVDVPIVAEFVKAFEQKTGVIYEGFRGKGKTTLLTAWSAYVIGARPVGSTALVRINDRKAKESGKVIAEIIESNPGWKKVFPNVVPDFDTGWSVENGFQVMDTNFTGEKDSAGFIQKHAEWRQLCLADHVAEPSLVCAGIESGSIIGMHPSNGMWFDDLHDVENTTSIAEMQRIVRIVEANLIPTWFSVSGSPTLGVFCTPWSINPPDAYQVMLQTGLFKHAKLPIFKIVAEGGEFFEPMNCQVELAWKEVYPIERVKEIYNATGNEFHRMYLLDVQAAAPKNFRYQSFPANEIKWKDWGMVAGVDPVATLKSVVGDGKGTSHFAMCYALKTPYNTVVIGDGVVEKIDADEGERRLVETSRTYRETFLRASIEQDGAGVLFIGMVTRNPGLRVSPHKTSQIGHGSKLDRQYQFLQPLFANGTILVSDGNTPYLNAVRLYLEMFPNIPKGSHLEDVGDSIVLAVFDMPETWTRVIISGSDDKVYGYNRGKDRQSLLEGFSTHRGY